MFFGLVESGINDVENGKTSLQLKRNINPFYILPYSGKHWFEDRIIVRRARLEVVIETGKKKTLS